MTIKRVLDIDPLTGAVELFHYDETDDTFVIETKQDVNPLLAANQAQFNEFSSARDPWGENIDRKTHVASIDLVTYHKLFREFGRDQAAWKRWLNDPANRAYRTRPGNV